MDVNQIKKDIRTQGLEVVLASNPRNPTGQVIQGEELRDLVRVCHDAATTLIMDEVDDTLHSTCGRILTCWQFYSWYIYPENEEEYGRSVSSAEFIDNVNQDPVVIVNGLTKVR